MAQPPNARLFRNQVGDSVRFRMFQYVNGMQENSVPAGEDRQQEIRDSCFCHDIPEDDDASVTTMSMTITSCGGTQHDAEELLEHSNKSLDYNDDGLSNSNSADDDVDSDDADADADSDDDSSDADDSDDDSCSNNKTNNSVRFTAGKMPPSNRLFRTQVGNSIRFKMFQYVNGMEQQQPKAPKYDVDETPVATKDSKISNIIQKTNNSGRTLSGDYEDILNFNLFDGKKEEAKRKREARKKLQQRPPSAKSTLERKHSYRTIKSNVSNNINRFDNDYEPPF